MELSESEKYFIECFSNVINAKEDVSANSEEIKIYGTIRQLEGEIKLLQELYDRSIVTNIQVILAKKKELSDILKDL